MQRPTEKITSRILTILVFSILDFCTATFFQDILKAPLFFDTIFMIAALFTFGSVAAFFEYVIFISLICAKLFVLYGQTDYVYLYTISALTIIVVTWLFVRKKENLKKGVNLTFLYILTASIIAGLACSVVSGFISYFTYNLNQKDWTFDQIIYAFNGEQFDFLASSILGRIPVIILDRIITTFAGFGIFKLHTRIMSHGGGIQALSKILAQNSMKRFLRLLVISALLSFSCCYADSAQEDLSRPNPIYENANSQKSALSNEEIILQLKEKNRELEETHQKLFSYFMWLIATILGGAVILVLLNVRENKHKNKIIYNSEQFLQHSIQVQESERRRISQELHDSVAQSLRYVSLLAEGLSDKVTAQKIIAIQNESIKNIRNLCYNLTPPVITGSNMIPLIALLGQKIFDTENSDFQFRVVCEPSVDFANLNGDELMNIYRIVQEALQNIQKHAQASEATVFFKKNEPKSLKIIITDDGCGMSESLISQINDDGGNIEPMHFGLRNIFERAKLIGGSVTYFSEEGFGTWLTVEI